MPTNLFLPNWCFHTEPPTDELLAQDDDLKEAYDKIVAEQTYQADYHLAIVPHRKWQEHIKIDVQKLTEGDFFCYKDDRVGVFTCPVVAVVKDVILHAESIKGITLYSPSHVIIYRAYEENADKEVNNAFVEARIAWLCHFLMVNADNFIECYSSAVSRLADDLEETKINDHSNFVSDLNSISGELEDVGKTLRECEEKLYKYVGAPGVDGTNKTEVINIRCEADDSIGEY